ncbi:MAG: hypothetical protein KI785_05100, partial [Devosiaceae bacterium]|nr:hypothetical protein [Devosiaceae bacterium MH13]
VTAPAPQAQHLLQAFGEPFGTLADIEYAPCYTLLAAFDGHLGVVDVPALPEGGPLGFACRQSARGDGRQTDKDLWVVQASPAFSQENLERERAEMVPVLLRAFQEAVGAPVPQPVYASGHRWRYAKVTKAYGEPYLLSADGTLGVAGDGMLGPRVELAFLSGAHCAQAIAA